MAPDGKLFAERMIPVRIMATREQINDIADMTAKFYEQLAVMYYKVSDKVVVKHYGARTPALDDNVFGEEDLTEL